MRRLLCAVACFVSVMLISSCERAEVDNPNKKNIPVHILEDFKSRYPNFGLLESESYSNNSQIYIRFNDQDGLLNTAVYLDGIWKLTQTEFDKQDFMNQLPKQVLKAYMGTGIEIDVDRFVKDDNSYVLAITRNGIDKKQYEFYFTAPYQDETYKFENLVHGIVIDEDGNLLFNGHSTFNRSIWWIDIDESIYCVRERYPNATILGTVNDGYNEFFILDDGVIKTVTVANYSRWEWKETAYLIDEGNLPESVVAEASKFENEHPDVSLYSVHFVETQFGDFYRFTYGDKFFNSSIMIKA